MSGDRRKPKHLTSSEIDILLAVVAGGLRKPKATHTDVASDTIPPHETKTSSSHHCNSVLSRASREEIKQVPLRHSLALEALEGYRTSQVGLVHEPWYESKLLSVTKARPSTASTLKKDRPQSAVVSPTVPGGGQRHGEVIQGKGTAACEEKGDQTRDAQVPQGANVVIGVRMVQHCPTLPPPSEGPPRPQRPTTAPARSNGRATSAGRRPLSGKPLVATKTLLSHREQNMVETLMQRDEESMKQVEDEEYGIACDDGDEDAELEGLGALRGNKPRVAGISIPAAGTNEKDAASAATSDTRHVLGTANVSSVRKGEPLPLYFSNFKYGDIRSFLSSRKVETFGLYGERVEGYLNERKGAKAALDAASSALPTPQEFRQRIEKEAALRHHSVTTAERQQANKDAALRRPLGNTLAMREVEKAFHQRPLSAKTTINRW